jgi:polysaccharide deacetylase family protein (PEP-CTERM system associated)
MKALLSVDVEDWFQVENLRSLYPLNIWDKQGCRIERNIDLILNILHDNKTIGTFFVLGWIAKRYPELINKIYNEGHEIACHGNNHRSLNEISEKEFRNDISEARKTIEDIIGNRIFGYRAPNFSIYDKALEILIENDFLYDSSFFPFKNHSRYGKLTNYHINKSVCKLHSNFYEVKISCLNFFKINIPWGGGGYFRLIPLPVYKQGVKQILKKENVFCFYIHPWELDTGQPRIKDLKFFNKFRHYNNLKKTEEKLRRLIKTFNFNNIYSAIENY